MTAYLISTSAVMLQMTREVAPTRSASDGGSVKMEAKTYRGEVPTSPCNAPPKHGIQRRSQLASMTKVQSQHKTFVTAVSGAHIHDAKGAEGQPQRPLRLGFLQHAARACQHVQHRRKNANMASKVRVPADATGTAVSQINSAEVPNAPKVMKAFDIREPCAQGKPVPAGWSANLSPGLLLRLDVRVHGQMGLRTRLIRALRRYAIVRCSFTTFGRRSRVSFVGHPAAAPAADRYAHPKGPLVSTKGACDGLHEPQVPGAAVR